MPKRAFALLLLIAGCHAGAAQTSRPPPVRCDHTPCPPDYSCRYLRDDAGAAYGVCEPEVGRCRFHSDCGPEGRCQFRGGFRPDVLGVCRLRPY